MLRTKLWISCSLLFVGCAGVQRPNTDLCVVNAPTGLAKCYNLRKDYDDDGNRNPDAKASYRPAMSVEDLNKYTCTDPDGLAEIKRFIRDLREELEDCKKGRRGPT